MQNIPDLDDSSSWMRALRAGDEVLWRDPSGERTGVCKIESIFRESIIAPASITSPYSLVSLRTAAGDLVETFAYEIEAHTLADTPAPAPAKAQSVGFVVTLNVVDQGDFDPATVRDALIDGIRRAEDEGNLTRLGDESTQIELVSVRQAINESAMLQFVQQIARLTLDSEADPATAGLQEHENNHDALMGLIRQARQLTDTPSPEPATPRRAPKP